MSDCYIYLVNIPSSCTWTNLQMMFSEFGKTTKIYMHPNRDFAKVYFETKEIVDKAFQFVNDSHPMGLSATTYTAPPKSKNDGNDSDFSHESNSRLPGNNQKHKYTNNDVDALVNRNYVDVFGRVVTTLQDDNGDLYISLTELKKSGFELFQVGSLPSRNSSRVYDNLKLSQFEIYMKTKAAKFLSDTNFNVPEETINNIIQAEKHDYFTEGRAGNISSIPSLLNIKTAPIAQLKQNEHAFKNNSVTNTQSKYKPFEKSTIKKDDGKLVNASNKINVENNKLESRVNIKENQFSNSSSLRRPLPITKENVEIIKPLTRVTLPLNTDHKVDVVHIESDKTVWVQLTSNMNIIENLMLEVVNECETAPVLKPTLNAICAASYNNIWFRAMVLNISPLKVQYIDYGNENTETLQEVRKLSEKLRSIPAQGIQVRFDGNIMVEQGATLNIHPTAQGEDGIYIVRMAKPKLFHSTPLTSPTVQKYSNNIDNKTISNTILNETQNKHPRKLSIETTTTSGIFTFGQKTSKTTFTAFGLPDSLTVEVCALEEISNDCKPDPTFKPNKGDLIAALTSQGLVRALVIDILNGQYRCGLIDFGTTEMSNQVCSLPDKYVSLPEFSFECKLDSDSIEAILKKNTGTLEIKSPGLVTFQLESDKEYEATGYRWDPFSLPSSNNTKTEPSKPNEYESNNKPKPSTSKTFQRKVVIEEISDNGLFDFVQETSETKFVAFACPESYAEEIAVLESINDDTQFDASFKPKIGDLVAAETTDGFVRGLVLDVLTNEYKCALIDFGTIKVVTQVRCLPDKYKIIPEFAFEGETTTAIIQNLKAHKCTSCKILSPNVLTITLENGNEYKISGHQWNPLKNISSFTENSTEKIDKLDNKLEKRIFKRKLVIEDVCDSGIFEYVASIDKNRFVAFGLPDSFAEDLCSLECLSEDCTYDPSFKPKLDDLIALKTTDSFGRGIILSIKHGKYTCALIDYGTIETTDKVYKLPNKYTVIPEFAFVCKIDTGCIDDFKNSQCVSLQIKTPNVLDITLKSGKRYTVHGSHWDPKKDLFKPIENSVNELAASTSTSNLIQNSEIKRKLVIDDVCETGVFEFVEAIDDTTFVGFAFPSIFIKESDKLKDITDDCTYDPMFQPKPGDLVAAPDPNGLVRALVISDLKGQYKCALIDYGLIAIVDKVYPLPDVYKSIPEFSFECKTNPEILETLRDTACKSLEIKSPRVLTLTLISGKVFQVKGYGWDPLTSSREGKQLKVSIQKPKQVVFKGMPSGNVLKDKEQVIIVGVLDDFLLVRNKECNTLFKCIQQELVKYKGDSFLKSPEVDYLAVCNFNDDNLYRVLVRSINGSSAFIEYIDYGDVASIPLKDLNTISDALASVKNTLIKIRLKNCVITSFSSKMLEALAQSSKKKEKFIVEKVVGEKDVYELIGADSTPLSTKLQDLTKPTTPAPGSIKKESITKTPPLKNKNICTIKDITRHNIEKGSNDFVCLFTAYLNEGNVSFCKADEETVELLNEVTLAIPEYIQTDKVAYEPELYEVCLVKFEDEWYRAAVLKINENKTYSVFYVDYGNSHVVTTNDIRKLPEELKRIRGLAILCTLEGVIKNNEEKVNDRLLSRLQEDILENQIYNVNVISCKNNEYRVTIPTLFENWKKDGLL
ncbi:hypothetical protein RN001_000831 [Aquatica leii]|uniref:Tudor domain-containing protein 1 n=1 Tax=Aquatica leii TaxID=1421715 RepID=A0AAN7PAL3_9COLE|nr:hypothetical protein RN001_000831 [Aquatica leii]